jgi:hypothetical protein
MHRILRTDAISLIQLLELERRIDSAFSRRVLEAEDDLKQPLTRPCRVQLCIFNTFSAQPGSLQSGISRCLQLMYK